MSRGRRPLSPPEPGGHLSRLDSKTLLLHGSLSAGGDSKASRHFAIQWPGLVDLYLEERALRACGEPVPGRLSTTFRLAAPVPAQ
jgi:hypothetical protein